jgi:two-component system, NtrC family, response regulator HydG
MSENSYHLILVEDDIDVQELITAYFRPKGFRTTCFTDAETALNALKTREVTGDAILTDLKLPGMSGIEFSREVKNTDLDIPIILTTSNKSVEAAVEAVNAGAYDFIVKPIHFPQLLISVERAIQLSRIKAENETLKSVIHSKETLGVPGVIAKSPGFKQSLDLAARVANSSSSVFISGESGTGKEVIARAIHALGSRKKGPFVAINCSAIPENLLESELFGHAKGAFTGAADKKTGLFEEAEGGTLFLDEIGDLGPSLQSKLLRVIQERKIRRIGENQPRPIDVRILSATHKNLVLEMKEGRFREDLFYRLNVIQIKIPPLRERKEDIVPLAEFFLKKFTAFNRSSVRGFSRDALELLLKSPWKGNVRELENAIERAVVLCQTPVIQAADLQAFEEFSPYAEGSIGDSSSDALSSEMAEQVSAAAKTDSVDFEEGFMIGPIVPMEEMVKRYIQHALRKNGGAKEKTAKELGIDRKTLYRKISEMEAGSTL